MKIYNYVRQGLVAFIFVFACIACEEELGEVGTGVVGSVNFETFEVDDIGVIAYSMNYPEGVQTNGAPVGVVGVYNDPVYGKTTASYLSQVALSRTGPEFGDNVVVDSVIFTLPYFARQIAVDEDGNNTYELDSVFRNTGGITLSAYRSNFFLNNLDPNTNFEDPEIYFSNDVPNFQGVEGDLLFQVNEFVPQADEIILTEVTFDEDGEPVLDEEDNVVKELSERISPALRLSLDTNYWNTNIIQREGEDVLLNINTFNDYFRGIYFKAEDEDNDGNLLLFDFSQANITIYYTFDGDDDSGEPGEPTNDGFGDISLNFSGVSVIDYQNQFDPAIVNAIENSNSTTGEENLYLKGGDGSIAIIELFGPDFDGDGIADQLEILRDCSNIIINEANLTFFVDQDDLGAGGGALEPERLFMLDFDNNSLLIDGVIDNTAGINGPVNTRTNHLGRLVREVEGDESSLGQSYRVRITQHVNNIIKNDSTNVRLALSVSQNVTVDNTSIIGGTGDIDTARRVPVSSVISPEGTILHGNLSTDEAKKLKLRIFYTLTEDIDPDSPCGQILGLDN
ncbi:DUF4270 domain-containing protein [Dokdonia ponticola]|uniref:DUF4270 domain-containing protein n=1 Tax=Dokdonia ponticola TaxID=2041041 RepID=A0ABV9I0M1_9FLAO